jgi:glyoxylase-like metal-dependent hydrolase (beta-lactamase superfamily II)
MAEEILPGLYRITVPLPGNPLGWVNSYVIRGQGRNLIIDTGLNRKECLDALQAGLSDLGIDLKTTDFYITHNHADHYALVPKLAEDTSTIYLNRPDKEYMENWTGWDAISKFAYLNGFPEVEIRKAIENHPGFKYGTDRKIHTNPVDDGNMIRCGDYRFTVLATPGHTTGHACLYEPDRKLLVSGDHILADITPNIACWKGAGNPLKNYLTSLNKVYEMDVDLVLPGHRRLLEEHRSRIGELKEHHQQRNSEILSILESRPRNAYQVASMMTWDIDCDSWNDFPVSQKWFATGEAIAHLRYLEEDGRVCGDQRDGVILFSIQTANYLAE